MNTYMQRSASLDSNVCFGLETRVVRRVTFASFCSKQQLGDEPLMVTKSTTIVKVSSASSSGYVSRCELVGLSLP
jgi:hypothetical protein